MNSINVISPYTFKGQWVFDDPTRGLVREAFVSGMDFIIDEMVKEIPNASTGFILLFSENTFPYHTGVLVWDKAEYGGNWYHDVNTMSAGWLCPALMKYFDEVPKAIYVQVKELA